MEVGDERHRPWERAAQLQQYIDQRQKRLAGPPVAPADEVSAGRRRRVPSAADWNASLAVSVAMIGRVENSLDGPASL